MRQRKMVTGELSRAVLLAHFSALRAKSLIEIMLSDQKLLRRHW